MADRDWDEADRGVEAEGTPATSAPARPRSLLRKWSFRGGTVLLVVAVAAFFIPWEYAYVPSDSATLNPTPAEIDQAFDVWGRRVSRKEAAELVKTDEGRALLSPSNGAVPTDAETLRIGRRAYHAETFGNEVFPPTSPVR